MWRNIKERKEDEEEAVYCWQIFWLALSLSVVLLPPALVHWDGV